MNDLTIPDSTALAASFSQPDGVDNVLSAIEAEVRSHAPDVTTAKGRKNITSLAYKVTQSKTAFDAIGKSLNDEQRAAIASVDAERRKIRQRLDELRDWTRAPLIEWEAAEAKKVQLEKERLSSLECLVGLLSNPNECRAEVARIEALDVDTWGEIAKLSADHKRMNLQAAQDCLASAKQRETDALELARLREGERQRAEEDAQRRADEQAKQAEHARKEREAVAADNARKEAEQAAHDRARLAEKKAKADKAEAERRHKAELTAASEREEQAAQRERDRIAREQAEAKAAEEKRAANTRLRKKVKADIANSIAKIKKEDIPQALLDGLVAHCSVKF